MTLYWRLVLGFLAATLATLAVQYALILVDGTGRTAPRLLLAGGQLVRSQGERAYRAWDRGQPRAAREALAAVDELGVQTWLVRRDDVLGGREIPDSALRAGRQTLRTGRSAQGFGLWTRSVGGGDAVLVVALSPIPEFAQGLRIALLFFVPAVVCLGLARWFARPIERLRAATIGFGHGDLTVRVGPLAGFREARELARSFDAMADRTQALIETQRRLLADVSHEVRSPLARIRLATEMLDGEDLEKNRLRIRRDVARLDELVEALATVVRIDHLPLVHDRISLGEVVAETLAAVSQEADRRGIRIAGQVEEVVVEGERRLLHSIVENLVRNALAHSSDGTEIEVRLIASPPTLTVLDCGPGVPPEDLERIFTPFFRVESARERRSGGTGLGLAIVRHAVERHGGTVVAENRPEGGLLVRASFGQGGD